jgi:hypothetical protein
LGYRVQHASCDVVGLERLTARLVVEERRVDQPGSMSVTRTPVPFSSCRAASPIAVTANFVAE